jgi:prepilin-type N-terminal cleavage/methylation domain-containing protein/prepilin-type processing-associated H-X9-DG protein
MAVAVRRTEILINPLHSAGTIRLGLCGVVQRGSVMRPRAYEVRCGNAPAGVTLVELLVVISIVATLAALLMPALSMVREAARKTSCVNNLASIAKGCMAYEAALGQLPGWRNRLDGFSRSKVQANEKEKACVSWAVSLLPYLGEREIFGWYEKYTGAGGVDDATRKRIAPYVCPSVAAETQQKVPAALSYVVNAGSGGRVLKGTGPTARQYRGDGVFVDAVGNVPSADTYVTAVQQYQPATASLEMVGAGDGDASTVLVAERSGLLVPKTVKWSANPRPAASGAPASETLHAFLQPIDIVSGSSYSPDPKTGRNGWMSEAKRLVDFEDGTKVPEAFLRYPSSAHGKGFPVAFCDGHVQVLGENIDPWVYAQLLSSDQANRSPEVDGWEKYKLNGSLVHYILDAKDVEKK